MHRRELSKEGFLSESNSSQNVTSKPRGKKGEVITWMSLPNKDQLFILALCRLSEPLSNTCLLPYIYYLIKSIVAPGTDKPSDYEAAQISKMSGILVAAFPLAQFATSMFWGRISDARGRKYIILFGLVASVISNLAFGLSRSFGALMFWRILAGLGNGNVGVMRTMTAEIVKERKYQTRAFLLLPLIFNAGMVAGLALGGVLADPVTNLAWLFGPSGLFNFYGNPLGVDWTMRYPYALPAFLNATVLGLTLLLAIFGLKESLPGKEHERDYGVLIGRSVMFRLKKVIVGRSQGYKAVRLDDMGDSAEEIVEDKPVPPAARPPTRPPMPFRKIFTWDVLTAIVSFGLLPLHNAAFMHIYPVYLSTPPADNTKATLFNFNGGLGLRSPSIGLYLSLFGIAGILLQLFVYPRIQARIGTLGVFRIACFVFPVTYALAPYLSVLPHTGFLRWFLIAVVTCAQVLSRTLAIPSTVILLTNSAPAKNVLGTVHGAGNSLSSLARAVGPAVGGWVYAWGMGHGVVGAVWWFYLTVVAGAALAWSYTMNPIVDE
ncbi:MFS general substrate transporter [Tothia fuscella]|uniref:MFS general substrate transporter n=1 Tax=Tothia fuscella TaxID=1048955 RepID=A0A9P4NSG8_9PEZI|nr:MFS general substrate transporter [Tothia fuscella]